MTIHAIAAGTNVAQTEITNLLNHYPSLSAQQGLLDKLRAAIANDVAERFDRG